MGSKPSQIALFHIIVHLERLDTMACRYFRQRRTNRRVGIRMSALVGPRSVLQIGRNLLMRIGQSLHCFAAIPLGWLNNLQL
jgi:hypothetical protein